MFLGVDGGGSGTTLCLLAADGTVRGVATAPSPYYFTAGIGLVERVLVEGVRDVCAAAGVAPADIEHAFVGLPAYGESAADLPALDAAPRLALGHDRYRCGNDMGCGWAGSLELADGVDVISGTGSMAYGERAGRGVRVGGWGELIGDEGSAYWIGARALRAFARAADGREVTGPLTRAVREHLGLAADDPDLDAVAVVNGRWQGSRRRIAGVAAVVDRAAREGDPAATALLAAAGRELADLVHVASGRLGFAQDEVVPVSWSGGVFASDAVRDAFAAGLRTDPRVGLRAPLHPPHVGAALYAARLAGAPLDRTALERLRRT